MADNNVEFTFDTSGFETAIAKMSEGMDAFKNDVMTQMKTTQDGFQKNIIGGVFKASIYVEALKKIFNLIGGISRSFFDNFKEFVPEFTRAFSVAKDIMFKNLFWPLRQVLLPYLQKMLDWVTANRRLFIQWGGVLVNVFKMAKQAFESFWHIVKPVAEVIMNMIKRIFGDTSKTIIETLNVMIFKVSSVLIAIELLLSPVMKRIAESMGWIGDKILFLKDKFLELGKSILGLGASAIRTSFNLLKNLIKDLFGEINGKDWERIGKTILTAIKIPFEEGYKFILNFIKGLKFIFDLIDKISTKGFKKAFAETDFKEFVENAKEMGKAALPNINPVGSAITKTFNEIKNEKNVASNKNDIIINMGGISIYPTNNGDINIPINAMVKNLRTVLQDEKLKQGER